MGSAKKTISYRFDSVGNRVGMTDTDGGRFTYAYDAVNRLSHLVNPQGDRTSYSYDAGGRRTVKKLANGTRASFSYDTASNLARLANLKSDGTTISSFDYKYDRVGNRTAVLESDGSRVTWSYDDTYQLTEEHRTGTTPYEDSYSYDAAGNRLLKIHDGGRTTYSYDAANQLEWSEDAAGRTTYTFDADGNQERVLEPTGDRTTTTWDFENRTTLVQLPSGIRNTMAYEPGGLRVKLEESTGVKKFIWDEQNYLAETDENDDTQVVYTNEPRVYGNLVSQRRGSGSHWYHFDAIGSTRELTESSETVTDTRLYDASGATVAQTGIAVYDFHFIGKRGYYFDQDTHQLYVRVRSYSALVGRWLSLDPLFMLLLNGYIYAHNTPTAIVDPSGEQNEGPLLPPPPPQKFRWPAPPKLPPPPPQAIRAPCPPGEYCPDHDYCHCCNDILNDFRQPPDSLIPPSLPGVDNSRCTLEVECARPCPGPDRDIPGFTFPRERGRRGSPFPFRIRICISCALTGPSIEPVLKHELIHAIRFCSGEGGIPEGDCGKCVTEEALAYRRSCREHPDLDQDKCIKCGVLLSCGYIQNCRLRGTPDDCSLAHVGIGVIPGCRFDPDAGIICDDDVFPS